jgi:uncharacterized DUF497 family protein
VLIEYDPAKREETLKNRGLDFEDAPKILGGTYLQMEDDRADYGETRWLVVGRLNQIMVALVWTQRGEARRIISMRKCNAREQKKYGPSLDRSRRRS